MKYMMAFLMMLRMSFVFANMLYPFPHDKQTQQFDMLLQEVRCLVCQNQNIADSHAPLAKDLREKIYDMVLQGETSEAIRSYLTTRYGDFILFNPPFKALTWVLWLAPFGLLLFLLYILVQPFKKVNTTC